MGKHNKDSWQNYLKKRKMLKDRRKQNKGSLQVEEIQSTSTETSLAEEFQSSGKEGSPDESCPERCGLG